MFLCLRQNPALLILSLPFALCVLTCENRHVTTATTYSLKAIVLARALAEMTVLTILTILPIALFATGHFFAVNIILRAGVTILALLSLVGLWGFGQIAFKVVVTDSGLTTQSIFRKHFLKWTQILLLKQRNRLGWKEYSLVHASGEVSFPCLLKAAPQLVETIRSRLPDRGRSTTGAEQLYRVGAITLVQEIAKLILQAGFAGLIFCFYETLKLEGKSSLEDILFVLALAVMVSAVVAWKLIQFLQLPVTVQLQKEGMTLKGIFRSAIISWSDIKKVANSGLMHPEGLLIRTDKHNYLIANTVDCWDELSEEIQLRSQKQATT